MIVPDYKKALFAPGPWRTITVLILTLTLTLTLTLKLTPTSFISILVSDSLSESLMDSANNVGNGYDSPISFNFSNNNLGARGRQRPSTALQPSGVRRASTSSLLRLRKSESRQEEDSTQDTDKCRSESLCRISNCASNGHEKRFIDVLPSFEMYNALHRHIPQGNVNADCHYFPPCYQEVQSQRDSMLTSGENPECSSLDFRQPNALLPASAVCLNNLHPLSTQHFNIVDTGSRASAEDRIPIEDDFNDADNINIDKLYTLPKLATPIDVDIRVTKSASQPHKKPEDESILKEYTSGDIIHGYCVVENKSPKNLKFEMFYVTLEGYISIIDREKGKRTVKRFLRMVDLSASWSYSHIDVSSGIEVIPGDVDYDNAIIGLNNNRILEPGVKYKKYFMFKLPNQLLDVTCKQEQFSHLMLPPSFGIDKYRNGCKYAGIKVNDILGCGHLGIKGTPILTSDLSDDVLSINYTIDARFVGKDKKTQRLNIMREHVYNLRVISFGFYCPVIGERACTQQITDLMKLVKEKLNALKLIFERLEKKEQIKETDIHNTDLSGTIDGNTELDAAEILRLKMHQLHLQNRVGAQSDVLHRMRNSKDKINEPECIEKELSYKLKPKSNSNLKTGLFNGFRSSNFTSQKPENALARSNKAGLIVLTADIPKAAFLPYRSPSLLRKKNKLDAKNEHDQKNWLGLVSAVPQDCRTVLKELEIRLKCTQSNNSLPHNPPEIQSLTTELVCITGRSDNSIPVKLDGLTLMNESKMNDIKQKFSSYLSEIKSYSQQFEERIEELNGIYCQSGISTVPHEMKFTDFISPQMLNDIESIVNFQTKIEILTHFFKKQLETLKDVSQDKISSSSSSSSLNKSSSSGFLSTTFSGSLTDTSKLAKFTEQLTHEWVKTSPLTYTRTVKVNLENNLNNRDTIIPTFESCLCCRFYFVRVNIKFGKHIGATSIDIPVNVKNLSCD